MMELVVARERKGPVTAILHVLKKKNSPRTEEYKGLKVESEQGMVTQTD